MINLREACHAELRSAAQLLARGMCDDPMHCTVFGTDPDYRRVRLHYVFAALRPRRCPSCGVDEVGADTMGFLEWARTVTISGQIGETRQT